MSQLVNRGIVVQGAFFASVIVAFLSFTSFLLLPITGEPRADMRIEPTEGVVTVGDTFVVDLLVTARTPVNVFKGEVTFDHTVLSVESIDYNTSIVDLWAELPWYENGEGTINFTGGTTQQGGFLGTDSIITITFRTHTLGDTLLRLTDARILEHNGLGTDVALNKPIDALFTVDESVILPKIVATPQETAMTVAVVPERPGTDVNEDGKQTLADISIFMLNMLGDDPRFDFNGDGKIDTRDLSIITSAK